MRRGDAMKGKKNIKNPDLNCLWKKLKDMGIYVEFFSNDVARIRSCNGRFTVKKTENDIMLMLEKQNISLCQYELKPLLRIKEDEYKTKSLFIVSK